MEECAKQCADYQLCSYFTYTGQLSIIQITRVLILTLAFFVTIQAIAASCILPTARSDPPLGRSAESALVVPPCRRLPGSATARISASPHWMGPIYKVVLTYLYVLTITFANFIDLIISFTAVSRLAEEADIAIAVVGTFAKEGVDRESLSFATIVGDMCQLVPKNQDEMIPVIAARAPTVVAMTGPGAVLMPWRNEVQALLYGFFPGEEYGHALMDVLFGHVNPSGRLPLTLPNVENEVGFSRAQFPGISLEGFYTEGMYVDYRWYTAMNVAPAFSFGHGLSYTAFEYTNFSVISPHEFSVSVQNIGRVAGAEVAQLYMSFPAEADTPPLQLRGFQKTAVLQPGGSETVSFILNNVDLSVWRSQPKSFWEVVHGTYTVFSGASSSDLRTRQSFEY